MLTVLDTHALVWLDEGSKRLGAKARKRIDKAFKEDQLAVSAISFWEIAMLEKKGRLSLSTPVSQLMEDLLQRGLQEIPVSGVISVIAAGLDNFHGDPADRLITATAISIPALLLTADQRILRWSGNVERVDAAK